MVIRPGPFTPGCIFYRDHYPGDREKRIVIPLRLGASAEWEVFAIVDTGAPWNIIDPQTARLAGISPDPLQPEHILMIRSQRVVGRLGRGPVTLRAEEGESLQTEGIFFLPDLDEDEPWPFPNFIGYGGLLEWVRFAVDAPNNRFWFGQ